MQSTTFDHFIFSFIWQHRCGSQGKWASWK